LPYSAARNVNVQGTRQILQLLALGKPKVLHYFSTISVLSDYTKERYEPEELEFDEGYMYVDRNVANLATRTTLTRGISTIKILENHCRDVGIASNLSWSYGSHLPPRTDLSQSRNWLL